MALATRSSKKPRLSSPSWSEPPSQDEEDATSALLLLANLRAGEESPCNSEANDNHITPPGAPFNMRPHVAATVRAGIAPRPTIAPSIGDTVTAYVGVKGQTYEFKGVVDEVAPPKAEETKLLCWVRLKEGEGATAVQPITGVGPRTAKHVAARVWQEAETMHNRWIKLLKADVGSNNIEGRWAVCD